MQSPGFTRYADGEYVADFEKLFRAVLLNMSEVEEH